MKSNKEKIPFGKFGFCVMIILAVSNILFILKEALIPHGLTIKIRENDTWIDCRYNPKAENRINYLNGTIKNPNNYYFETWYGCAMYECG
jgi:hypothetical protein